MMAVASNLYCAAAAPPGLLATLNGAVGSVHYSFGKFRLEGLKHLYNEKKLLLKHSKTDSISRSWSGKLCRWYLNGNVWNKGDVSHLRNIFDGLRSYILDIVSLIFGKSGKTQITKAIT